MRCAKTHVHFVSNVDEQSVECGLPVVVVQFGWAGGDSGQTLDFRKLEPVDEVVPGNVGDSMNAKIKIEGKFPLNGRVRAVDSQVDAHASGLVAKDHTLRLVNGNGSNIRLREAGLKLACSVLTERHVGLLREYVELLAKRSELAVSAVQGHGLLNVVEHRVDGRLMDPHLLTLLLACVVFPLACRGDCTSSLV